MMKYSGPILLASGIALGALGAHFFKPLLTESALESYKTGVLYQLIIAVVLLQQNQFSRPLFTSHLLTWGVVLFSFSIYGLAIDELWQITLSVLGPITPFGGVLMIAGALSLAMKPKIVHK